MKRRCSTYNPVLFFFFFGIFIFYNLSFATAQCNGDFSYHAFPSVKKSPSGKIEITLKGHDIINYTFQVYKVDGVITLVQAKEASAPEKIIFEGLSPATYFVKISWGESCFKTIGGLEGITITDKDKGR